MSSADEGEIVYSSRHILDEDPHLREPEREALRRVRDSVEKDAEGLR